MLNLQKILKARSLNDLRNDPFNLHLSASGDMVLFKYNQFDSDFSNKVVKESRGIILDKKDWSIVCHPFHKFFNLGEVQAFNINLLESYVIEKVDGSIIKTYFYDDEWHIATNGTIDADDASNRDGITFKELFFDVISEEDFKLVTGKFDTENTYLFEMVHPANQIVVNYGDKKELVFTGMIRNETIDNIVMDYDIFDKKVNKKYTKIFKNLPIRFPDTFDLNNTADINDLSQIADDENAEGNEFEGFVVSQVKDGLVIGRVKIKSPKYVNLHHVATGESVTNNLIDVLLKNEIEEFEVYLTNLPEHVAEEYKGLKVKYFNLIEELTNTGERYRKTAKKVTRKELALDIIKMVKKSHNGIIFTMVDKPDVTPVDILRDYGIKKVRNLLI